MESLQRFLCSFLIVILHDLIVRCLWYEDEADEEHHRYNSKDDVERVKVDVRTNTNEKRIPPYKCPVHVQ